MTHVSWNSLLQHNESTFGEKRWLIYIDEHGKRFEWSYAVFIDTTRRLATMLSNSGIQRGDRVAIAGHNHPDTILGYFACWLLGVCAVPLNMTEDNTRLAYIIDNSESKLILCRTEYLTRIKGASSGSSRTPTIIDVDSDAADSSFYSAIRQSEPIPYSSTTYNLLDAECLIVYTSGTTGNPKGVVLIQQNLFADGTDIAQWHGITEESRMMCVLPVHHVNGTIVTHVAPFIAGASVVLNRKFSPHSFFQTIRNESVNVVSVVPTLLALLLEAHANSHDVMQHGFSHIICGAGPLTCELADRFETAYGIRIVHGYGLSETTCYTCFLPRDLTDEEHRHWMQDFGFPSIGVAIPCNEMQIHDAMGRPLPAGERGEIVARGSNIMKGYYNNDKANREAFEFGWFRSGDEGFFDVDEKGREFFFITGRIKELIIRGGVNIAPLEIDEVINRAPGVKAGICVGFENTIYGEEVGALVVPLDETANEETILAFCRQHLPHHKAPKVVLFAESLPVTSTGKYQRNKVKHLFAHCTELQFKK